MREATLGLIEMGYELASSLADIICENAGDPADYWQFAAWNDAVAAAERGLATLE